MAYIYGAVALILAAVASELTAHLSERLRPRMRRLRAVYLALILIGVAFGAVWAGMQGRSPQAIPMDGPAPPPGLSDVVPVPGVQGGWGPERRTYSMEHPSTEPALNSIRDNKVYGDERNFVQVRNLTRDETFSETANACRGEHAEWFVLLASDASPDLGDAGTVRGLTLQAMAGEKPSTTPVTVWLRTSNAGQVWDSASVSCGGQAVTLRFLPGTARVVSNSTSAAGWFLDGDPFQGPLTIGAERADGLLPADKLSNGKDGWVAYVVFQTVVL